MSRKQIAGGRSRRLWTPAVRHHQLEGLDEVRGPRPRLLGVVQTEDRLLRERGASIGELGGGHAGWITARRDGRFHHLGVPPRPLGFGDPAGAVAVRPHQLLDAAEPESRVDLKREERHHVHLGLAEQVVGRGLRRPDRLADGSEQLERDARASADLGEGLTGQGRVPLVGVRVEEVEGERAASQCRGEVVEPDRRLLERGGHEDPAHVARREPARLRRCDDAELHQAIHVLRLHSGARGRILA